MRAQGFRVRVAADPRGHGVIAVPFDPDAVRGVKAVHRVKARERCQATATTADTVTTA
jgi:hypothetical protein